MSHDPSLLTHLTALAPNLADLVTAFIKSPTAEYGQLQALLNDEMRHLFVTLVNNPNTDGWCRWNVQG